MPVQFKPMIAEAFIRLSKQKNIDKITVKDLVEACGISRQTFYYHFQDILEVIEWSLDQAFSHLLEQSLAAEAPCRGSRTRTWTRRSASAHTGLWGCCSRAARKRAPTAPAAHGRCTSCSRAASGRTGRSPSNNSIPSGGQFAYLQSAPSVRTDPQECQKF